MDLCKFKTTLGNTSLKEKQNQAVLTHIFNPNTWVIWEVLLSVCCLYWLVNKETALAYSKAELS